MHAKRADWAGAISLLIGVCFSAVVLADQQIATWTGGAGSWENASQWSGGVVPNNLGSTTFAVQIDGGNAAVSSVSLGPESFVATPFSANVDSLVIDTDDALTVFNATLTVNDSITVNGTLNFGVPSLPYQAGWRSQLSFAASTTLRGSGTIVFNQPWYTSNLSAQSGVLAIDSGITIRGGALSDIDYEPTYGVIGNTATALVNRGHVIADLPYRILSIRGSTIDNQGVLEARNGGVLAIDADFSMASIGSLDYSGGTLYVRGVFDNSGQNLHIDNAHGGFALGSYGGTFGNPATMGVVRGGSITTGDGKALLIAARCVAELDAVQLNGTARALGKLVVPAGQAFSGNGDILLPNPQYAEDLGQVTALSGPTTIAHDITVHGGTIRDPSTVLLPLAGMLGSVGSDGELLINQGTIRASHSGVPDVLPSQSLYLYLRGSSISNAGVLEADDAAILFAIGSLSFENGSHLTIEGTGNLQVMGDLDLSSAGDFLDALALPDGGAYDAQPIVTYNGMRLGEFDHVTQGIMVDYSTPGVIRISGTPVPEPAALLLGIAGIVFLRRRGRCD